MASCSWPIPCKNECFEDQDFCRDHCKAQGINIRTPPKEKKPLKKQSDKAKSKEKESKSEKEALNKFFEDALLYAPFHCENCGADLRESFLRDRAIVCHLLPKKSTIGGFPSVATNPNNKFYGCNSCHHGYDNIGSSFILKMPLLPTIKQRVSLLIPFLSTEEVNKIPEYLKL